jgi:heptosyltransferase-2
MSYQTILVVKNRAMGDSIMGLSTIQYIKELYPNARIIYALPSWITKLYKNVDTAADEVISCDLKTAKDWFKFYRKVRSIRPDVIYEMHQAGRSKKFFDLYSKVFQTPYFFHNHHIKSGGNIHDQGVIKPVIQRDLDGVFSTLTTGERYPEFLNYTPLIDFPKDLVNRVVLGVVATRETKMWPLAFYVDLAEIIKKSFPDLSIEVPLSTSEVDLSIKDKLIDLGAESFLSIVHIPLEDLTDYIGNSKLYIGNDTGIKHLAIATGVKSYTLFGPEPPNEWHPYNENRHPYFYKTPLECRTKDAHYCGLSTCNSMICLNEFLPGDVFEKIREDLND